jgi:hypothetical protein
MKQDSRNKNKFRIIGMLTKLDFYFPFLVFFYGLVVSFVLEIPTLVAIARKELPSQYATLMSHQKLAWISLVFGGLWSLQNLWFS